MFFLASELGMTIQELTSKLTQEEYINWLAYYELKEGDVTVLEIYWNPLPIAERESIVGMSGDSGTNDDFALNLMITKALDKDGKRLFQDGHKASLRREVNATTLQDIQLAMLNSGSEYKMEEEKADLKSKKRLVFYVFLSIRVRNDDSRTYQ